MTDAEGIKAWLDRWDDHQNDNCRCEKCRRKRAILMAVEALGTLDLVVDHMDGDLAGRALASIRKTLVSE